MVSGLSTFQALWSRHERQFVPVFLSCAHDGYQPVSRGLSLPWRPLGCILGDSDDAQGNPRERVWAVIELSW